MGSRTSRRADARRDDLAPGRARRPGGPTPPARRTGRPETVRPSLALYLTNRPPTQVAVVLGLCAETFEIPPPAQPITS